MAGVPASSRAPIPLRLDPSAPTSAPIILVVEPTGQAQSPLKINAANSFQILGTGADGGLFLTTFDANSEGLSVDAGVAMTSDLVRFADQSGNQAWTISPNGYMMIRTDSGVPANGELANGECALWYDKTNGAAKLMVKAKQADGTVRTATINLA